MPDGSPYDSAFARFVDEHPGYAAGSVLDDARATDYRRLDETGHTYLDFTGGGLYGESQLRRHHELLSASVLGNPHSHNPTSMAATALVEAARSDVLDFFNADPDEYDVVFTANASGALKLVGESYPFTPESTYLVSYDNHNSVNGIREFARAKCAPVVYVPVRDPDLRLDDRLVMRHLAEPGRGGRRLFAYPAQSNFSGVRHPLEWVDTAHEYGWDVLLDCAAFAPTNRLDLSAVHPDFVPLSFYKMFGYPTGVGALVARHEALARLQRPWFAGGTITLASVQGEGWHHLAPGHAGFEDGTVDYLGLPAISIGLDHLSKLGIDAVHSRVEALTAWLLATFADLRHANGSPAIRVFGPNDTHERGATIAFHVLDAHGAPLDVYHVEELAGRSGISVRTGCFCNPGDGEVAHRITPDEMASCFAADEPVTLGECQRIIEDATGKVPNTIRVSLGVASNFSDVWRLTEFLSGFLEPA